MERTLEMDALQNRLIPALALLLLLPLCSCGQSTQRSSSQPAHKPTLVISATRMDTLPYTPSAPEGVHNLMAQYAPQMNAQMNKVVGYTVEELAKASPESNLSNMVADGMLAIARRISGMEAVDFAVTNFGGIRTSMPNGDVRLYDIFSIFPFENALVLLTLKGSSVKDLFDSFARRYVEVIGGARVVFENKQVKELTINGQPFDENKEYHLVTLDFLLDGGDNIAALKTYTSVDFLGITLRDAMLQYIETFTKNGEPIQGRVDGRVTYIE